MTTILQPDDATIAGMSEPAKSRASRRVRGLSDRTIAWLFVAPTIALLLAINIFPLVWMIRLSFTSLNLSMSYLPLRFVGLDNFTDILTDEDVWFRLQATAQFVIWSVALQVVIGYGLALLINRQFRGHSFWTTIIRPRDFDKSKGYPVIVHVYGGPTHQMVVASMGTRLIDQWLADQGFVVVAVDNRGTPGRGRAWEKAVYEKFGTVPLLENKR